VTCPLTPVTVMFPLPAPRPPTPAETQSTFFSVRALVRAVACTVSAGWSIRAAASSGSHTGGNRSARRRIIHQSPNTVAAR